MMVKLCKLMSYMLLTLMTVVILNGFIRISPYIQGILCLIVVYSAVYDGAFTGTAAGAFTGIIAGAFEEQPMIIMLFYPVVGFVFGIVGDVILRKNYVNIIICSSILCLIKKDVFNVDITTYAEGVFIRLAVTICGAAILYLPLKMTGGIKWKKTGNLKSGR